MKTWWMRRNSRKRFEHIRPYLEGDTLLDIGAAEGWIGDCAHRQQKMQVQLLDVVNLNQTSLPHRLYNGRQIPFPDQSFSTVTLLLTLHHCNDPVAVLREAARVCRGTVIVTESVYHNRLGRILLTFLDHGFNGLRSGRLMPPALHFRTVPAWRKLFTANHFAIRHETWLSRGLHQQRLFVLQSNTLHE